MGEGKFSRKLRAFVFILTLGLVACPLTAALAVDKAASDYDNILGALKNGNVGAELRLGYELSDLDNNMKSSANSVTLRTRLSYRTGNFDMGFAKLSGYIQFHNLSALLDHYGPGNKDYDVVADPDGSRLQQSYFDLEAFDTTLRAGRQEIIMDDHRLVGNIGWRQNGQSFNAVSLTNKSIKDLELYAGYILKVNTILLKELDLDDAGMILVHAKYTGIKDHSISLYNYLLDSNGGLSSDRDVGTVGARLKGKSSCTENFGFEYEGDYSQQYDYKDSTNRDAYMLNAFIGVNISRFGFGAGLSKISGKRGDSRAFDTLFSTAHKFNGWSDQFLATNGGGLINGLEDLYIQFKARCKKGNTNLLARYHFFDSTDKNTYDGTYGNEVNVQTVTKIGKNTTFLLKYASYFASNGGPANPAGRDENLFWSRVTYKF